MTEIRRSEPQIYKDKKYKNFKVIFECIAGSRLYGTSTPVSDTDIRGVFIPPREYFLGFLNNIEQVEEKANDITFYDVRKFFKLCTDCNPNIVELLFVPDEFTNKSSSEWEKVKENRDLFLSTKARYTFSGYAISQLHRIKQHRNWLLNPQERQPTRSDFGLPEDKALVSKDQLNAFNELVVNYSLKITEDLKIDSNMLDILQREKSFQNKNREWSQYQNWKTSRNPDRAALEEKLGYDTKHGSHLYRLVTEGRELLLTGTITFPRPDSDIILEVRNGSYSYEGLMELVGDIDSQFSSYSDNSVLPHSPDRKKVDELCIKLVGDYI